MEKKKKKSWILVTILIVILLIAATLGGYLAGASRIANDVVKQRNDNEEAVKNTSLFYDENKIENKQEGQKFDRLSISGFINGVSYEISENKKVVYATLNWSVIGLDYFGEAFPVNRTTTDVDKISIDFDKDVVEIYAAGFGQDTTGAVIIFLLEDGTAKYVNEYEAVRSQSYKNIKDLKLKDIVKFYGTGVTGDHFGHYTTVAQTKDGKLYDLDEFVD